MDTSGFYKLNIRDGGLIFAPNFVISSNIELRRENEDSLVGEHEGWKWFETDIEAYTYFGIAQGSLPWTINSFQAKLVLYRAGLLTQVESLIAESDIETKIVWNTVSHFNRNSTLLNRLAMELGLSEEQVDNLFKEAALIEV